MDKTLLHVLQCCAPPAPAGFAGPVFRVAEHPHYCTPTFYADYEGRPEHREAAYDFGSASGRAFHDAWMALGGSEGYEAEIWFHERGGGVCVISWAVSLLTAEQYRGYLARAGSGEVEGAAATLPQ